MGTGLLTPDCLICPFQWYNASRPVEALAVAKCRQLKIQKRLYWKKVYLSLNCCALPCCFPCLKYLLLKNTTEYGILTPFI